MAEVRSLASANFYSQAILKRLGWDEGRSEPIPRSSDGERERIRELLARLHSSHTAYYTREDPEYWGLLSIFEANLDFVCGDSTRLPAKPIQVEGVGVLWKEIEARWYVVGIYPEGPGARAGLLVGDEIEAADSHPYSPILAFKGKAGEKVVLRVRRRLEVKPFEVAITPRWARPQAESQEALSKSVKVISTPHHRIGYFRVWSWAGEEMEAGVVDAILELNRKGVDSWILDLRDGWGGASPEFEAIFSKDIPRLETTDRNGHTTLRDTQLRGPTVVLINGGTRSGKEIIAYAAKRSKAATLVGEQTAGAMLAGRPFCLSNGALLYLATADVSVSGERLEGRGVTPDVVVPFDVRHSSGEDPQLTKAVSLLSHED